MRDTDTLTKWFIPVLNVAAAVALWGILKKPGYADNSTVEARALSAWNTRATPPDVQAEIAHLKAIIADRDKRLSVSKYQVKGADNLFNEARAEIDRLKATATEREGFIDQLLGQRHAELVLIVERVSSAHRMGVTVAHESIIDEIEQERTRD